MEYTKEGASTFPPPPGYFRSKHGLIPDDQDLALRLAEDFSDTNNYGLTLAYYAEHGRRPPRRSAAKSPPKARKPPRPSPTRAPREPDRDPVESKSRVTLEEDQDQI